MTIALPDALQSFVDAQVAAQGYETGGEYMQALIRKDLDREWLRTLLLQAAHSPPAAEADAAHFDALRTRIRNHRRE